MEAIGGGNDFRIFDVVIVARTPIRTIEGLIPDARGSVPHAVKLGNLFV